MSSVNLTPSQSWCPTAASTAAFHQEVNRVLTPSGEQLHLALPRFHFGNALAQALHDQQYRWENREVIRDRAIIEAEEQEEAAENERQWREAMRNLPTQSERLGDREWSGKYGDGGVQ
jgi:hypothetical protein